MKYRTKTDKLGQLRAFAFGSWRTAIKRECVYCGENFVFIPSLNAGGKYCSKTCAAKGMNKYRRTQRVTVRCTECLKFRRIKRSEAEKTKTCGRVECVSKRRSRLVTERHRIEGGLFGRGA